MESQNRNLLFTFHHCCPINLSFRQMPESSDLSTIKIKSLWIPACAGMTAVAFIVFMFFYVAFMVFPNHDNGLTTTYKLLYGTAVTFHFSLSFAIKNFINHPGLTGVPEGVGAKWKGVISQCCFNFSFEIPVTCLYRHFIADGQQH